MYTFLCVLHTLCSWGAFQTKHIPISDQHNAIMQSHVLVIPFVAACYHFGFFSIKPFVTNTKQTFHAPCVLHRVCSWGEALRPPPNPLQLLNRITSKTFYDQPYVNMPNRVLCIPFCAFYIQIAPGVLFTLNTSPFVTNTLPLCNARR